MGGREGKGKGGKRKGDRGRGKERERGGEGKREGGEGKGKGREERGKGKKGRGRTPPPLLFRQIEPWLKPCCFFQKSHLCQILSVFHDLAVKTRCSPGFN